MSEILKIRGGIPLSGEVVAVPNKNAVLASLPASILSDKDVIYKNLPDTLDVEKILKLLTLLGAEVTKTDSSTTIINCKDLNKYELDATLANSFRSSILFAGPLLARFKKAIIPLPGGCVLGKRSIAAHIDAFNKVGINAAFEDNHVIFTAPKTLKKNYAVWMMEASVTATENLALYAAGCDSSFEITESACEPHVRQLLVLLRDMGAGISGEGSNKIYIKGTTSFSNAEFIPEPDFVDIAGIIVATAITQGKVTIKDANIPQVVDGLVQCFEKFNIIINKNGNDLIVDGTNKLKIDTLNSGFPMAGEGLPKLLPRPWPGIPVDVLPVLVTLACKTDGRILIQNWMYETGLDFIRQLNALGANIFMADPQRVIVSGPVRFSGGTVHTPAIIQAVKALFLASLADEVDTTLIGTEVLKRRYPNILAVYKNLGAHIEVM